MDKKILKAAAALRKHGFEAEAVKGRGEARERILELIPATAAVGVPGSATVRALGVLEELRKRRHKIYDHWTPGLDAAQSLAIRKQQLAGDVLLTSTNALTLTGELVNMDGIGNRVAAMIFGPGRVIIVAGKNKIVSDLKAAQERIQTIAAPRRARELKIKTPCARKGVCTDCNVPGRICRAEVVLHRRPSLTEFHVIIIDEELGN